MCSAKKPKIAVVTLPLPFHNKSGEVILNSFLKVIEPICERIFVVTGNYLPNDFVSNSKITVNSFVYAPSTSKLSKRFIRYMQMHIILTINLFKTLRKSNVDMTIFLIASPLLAPHLIAKIFRQKTIIIATGSQSKSAKMLSGLSGFLFSKLLNFLETISFILATKIAVESKSVVDFINLKKFTEKLIVPFGNRYVDTDLFAIKTPFEQRKTLIGYVGRFSPEKGILPFIKAIPKLAWVCGIDVKFLVVGDGPLRNHVNFWIQKWSRTNRIDYREWVSHRDLPNVLNELKLIVLPSYTEGLPGIVQEAMASGTIVLSTPVGGVPDLIEDKKTGFIMQNNSPECIVHNVKRVLSCPDLKKIVRNAREFSVNNYSYDMVVERHRNILELIFKQSINVNHINYSKRKSE